MNVRRPPTILLVSVAMLALAGLSLRAQQPRAVAVVASNDVPSGTSPLGPTLLPTRHPPVPRELSQFWMAPERGPSVARVANTATLVGAVKLIDRRELSRALTALQQPSLKQGLLAGYAGYYAGITQLELLHAADALKTFKTIEEQKPFGYLAQAVALGEAKAYEAMNDQAAAVGVYEQLLQGKPLNPEDIYMRLGYAAHAAHDRNKAADAFARVYYEFALTDRAGEAGTQLALLEPPAITSGSPRYKLELGRGERLFGARLYGPAKSTFTALLNKAPEEDRELVQLRIAECDVFAKRSRIARDALLPLTQGGPRRGEALYFYAVASRDALDEATFLKTARRVASEFPTEHWAEESLNALGNYFLRKDRDDEADATFRELYNKYPKGPFAEHAAWVTGWRSYRDGQYGETLRIFEHAAADFPRSDYRPAWLYWTARAYEQSKNAIQAETRYELCVTDYLNSYYGRLALKRMDAGGLAQAMADSTTATPPKDIPLVADPPPNAPIIRALLNAELYDDALNELRFAQHALGPSSAIDATMAWINSQQSVGKKGSEEFGLRRGAMTQMKRAYPQFLAAGGENLPPEVLAVIFPLRYWDLIKRYSAANDLDPYLVSALVVQESTFVADIRSSANAYGLMQLLPGTAREFAKKVNITYSTRLLTDPEANIKMGTKKFGDAVKSYGSVALALASYNAGDRPVKRWVAERPGLGGEEFIDDIPYPETQNYVKRILGMADDYRRIYASLMSKS